MYLSFFMNKNIKILVRVLTFRKYTDLTKINTNNSETYSNCRVDGS